MHLNLRLRGVLLTSHEYIYISLSIFWTARELALFGLFVAALAFVVGGEGVGVGGHRPGVSPDVI